MISRRLVWSALAILAGAVCSCLPRGPESCRATALPGPSAPAPAGELTCYLAQLHLHGHSNHNGNALPASMESHSAEAERNGFDVVWWTDHTELFDGLGDAKIDFAAAAVDSDGKAVALSTRQGRRVSSLRIDGPEAGVNARIEDGRLLVSVTAGPGTERSRTVTLAPASNLGKVRVIEFCRPVSSGLKLDAYLDVDGLGTDTYIAFAFDFSWHPAGQHHARFEGVAAGPGAPLPTSDTTVVGQFAVPRATDAAGGNPGLVSIDLEKALSLLPQGRDNTLSSFSIEIGARSGGVITVGIDSLVLRSGRPGGANQFLTVDSLAREHATRFGLRSYVGIETGKVHTPQSPHMNGYLPQEVGSYKNLYLGWRMPRDQWIAVIHENGGLVSFNHPFGASRNPRGRPNYQVEEDEDASDVEPPRLLAAKRAPASEAEFWEVAEPMLEGRGLGADLLEVGYIYRGIGSLEDHLRLWDLALANGVGLVGIGTSDSHGGEWGPDMVPNPFATWIWAETSDAVDLIEALRRGHAAFGDPFNFKGDFAFMAKDSKGRTAMMGDTLVVPAASKVIAWAVFEPTPDSLNVELVEVKMNRGRVIDGTRRLLSGTPYGLSVVAKDSCFVRLEVRAGDGTPLVFSNPIYVFPER